MSDDWLIFSTKRRFYGVFRTVSPDCSKRTWSPFFIPPTRQSLFLPSEVQSRVCRPAVIQTILCKNRSGTPSLSPLLSSSSCRLASACLPIFSTHAGTACFRYAWQQIKAIELRWIRLFSNTTFNKGVIKHLMFIVLKSPHTLVCDSWLSNNSISKKVLFKAPFSSVVNEVLLCYWPTVSPT